MATIIEVTDLPTSMQSAELVSTMVAGANAKASRVAPCLTWDGSVDGQPVPSADQLAEAKLVLIGAVKRWVETGAGSLQSQTAGPFSQTLDTRQRTGYNLWPSEIEALQDICRTGDEDGGPFDIDTVSTTDVHQDICALNFGATYCSCAADIAGYPLYEYGFGL